MTVPITDVIYWDDSAPEEFQVFGEQTAQIIDEREGGAIAYCHHDSADRLVVALRAYDHHLRGRRTDGVPG